MGHALQRKLFGRRIGVIAETDAYLEVWCRGVTNSMLLCLRHRMSSYRHKNRNFITFIISMTRTSISGPKPNLHFTLIQETYTQMT